MEKGEHTCRCKACRKDPKAQTARVHRGLNRIILIGNEKQRRLTAGLEAVKFGWGGVTKVSEITGLSRTTILQGIRDLEAQVGDLEEIRKTGAGRPRVEKKRRRASADTQTADEGRDGRRPDEGHQVGPEEHPQRKPGTEA